MFPKLFEITAYLSMFNGIPSSSLYDARSQVLCSGDVGIVLENNSFFIYFFFKEFYYF